MQYLCHISVIFMKCGVSLGRLRLFRHAFVLGDADALEWIDQSFVATEQMLDPVAVAGEWGCAVEPVDGSIERGMGFAQIAGHRVGIVGIGEA